MPFDESIKAAVRKRAHFSCCLCHDLGVEIHHVVPEAEGGSNAIENAAPLCPSCHERYGANPQKRKFIREARDFWFEICDERYGGDEAHLLEIRSALADTAKRQDVERVVDEVRALLSTSSGNDLAVLPPGLGGESLTATSIRLYLRFMYPSVIHCGPANCESLAADLREIGYTTVRGVHNLVGFTKEPLADVLQGERDVGEDRFGRVGDDVPVRLFLAVLDENYSKRNYPKLYEEGITGRDDYPWHRRSGDPEPSSPVWAPMPPTRR